ncbi:hypothetical protein [Marimonas arenosa]|uniref:Uncharacterized protein n=1 Tax=Marimonas arenosa TaxID=1795305 RepID=A0AAE3WCV4_9RHOB|nr:hypothetical protein [Marimonas arenosa]MDQ2089293.1 hypothetical protein [Marimonas arenosa]
MSRYYLKALGPFLAATLAAGAVQADQVFLDDVIVDGSLCVGFDCVNGESFGFNTIKLKENNLRIKFEDTSSSASFPDRDWQLEANETSNGGQERFAIVDLTASRTPFVIEGNAPSNSLYVDDGGRIGNGTSTPVVQIHSKDGNTPTLRLEQDGSSGFTAQTFDIAANEANFFIRDVTNGSQLPFRIQPGADTNALYIANDNDIGMGAGTNPDASLHVERSDGTAKLKVEENSGTSAARTIAEFINNGRPDLVMANTSTGDEWSFGAGTNFIMKTGAVGSDSSAKTKHLTLYGATGNLEITGEIITGGTTCGGGCDLVFSDDYDLPSIAEHTERMYALGHLPNVGPTIENQPINLTDKVGRMLNELEHAHIYIDDLHGRLAAQEAMNSALLARLEALEAATKN